MRFRLIRRIKLLLNNLLDTYDFSMADISSL